MSSKARATTERAPACLLATAAVSEGFLQCVIIASTPRVREKGISSSASSGAGEANSVSVSDEAPLSSCSP